MKSLSSVLALIVIFVSSAFAAQSDRITSAIDARTVEIPNHVRMQAQPKNDQGAVEPGFRMSYMTLLTAPTAAQKASLDKLIADQQNPRSPMFRHWLTPQQMGERFGLSAADIGRLTSWLTGQGFKVERVAKTRNFIVFSGTASQVRSAFGTEIHRFNVEGEEHFANSTNPVIPAALSGVVTYIRGLDNFRMKPSHYLGAQPQTISPPGPQSSRWHHEYYDSNYPAQFLAPGDISTIYDTKPLYQVGITGHSATSTFPYDIAIMGQTDIFLADLQDFRSGFGLPAITGCTTDATTMLITACSGGNLGYQLIGTDPGVAFFGDLGESDLDLEWSNAAAPQANIILVNGETAGGVLDALYSAISSTVVAPIISFSYGRCELGEGGAFTTDENELALGVGEGITILASSGDQGAAACDTSQTAVTNNLAQNGIAVSYPASSKYVIAVGGTAVPYADLGPAFWGQTNATDGGSALGYVPGEGWNDDAEWGSYCAANGGCIFKTGTVSDQLSAQAFFGIVAGGGGVSSCTNQSSGVCLSGTPRPTWQPAGFVAPAGQIGVTKTRLVPDISGFGSVYFTGYVVCVPQSELKQGNGPSTSTCVTSVKDALDTYGSVFGGTSVSTPIYAGAVALLNEYLGGAALGDIHIPLYQFAVSAPTAFHQITAGDNTVYCSPGTPVGQASALLCPGSGILGFQASNFDATTGYNVVTGLGSLDVNNLAIAWSASRSGTTTGLLADHASIFQSQSVILTATVTPPNATGSVTFYSGIAVLGTANVDNVGQAQLTTTALPLDSPAGTPDSITAKYNGDGFNGTSTSTAVTIDVVAAFTLAASGSAATTQGGTAGPITITPTPAAGFTGNLTYSCTTTASEATCTASPNTAVNQSTPVSVSITTTAPQASLQFPGKGSGVFYALLLPGLLGLVLAGKGNRKGRTLMMLGFMAVLATSTMWMSACSSSSSTKNPGTPKGMYPVTVSATTGGANAITNTVTFTMTVN
jgi:subtilase family serine protease